MDADKNISQRRSWTNTETLAFLNAYGKRKAEFDHPRKKKFAMNNVLEDLLAAEVLTQHTTADMLSTKLKNLKRAFKESTDNNNRTGAAPSTAPFQEIMEDIFGKRPEIRNNHTVNLYGKAVKPLPITHKHYVSLEEEEMFEEPTESIPSQPLTSQPPTSQQHNHLHRKPPSSSQPSTTSHSEPHNFPTTKPPSTPKTVLIMKTKKKSVKENYFQEKINVKREKNEITKEYYAKKIEKLEEAERGRNNRMEKKTKILKEIFEV